MYQKYTVEIPKDSGLINTKLNKKTGERYVEYAFEKNYRKDKGYYANKRTTIGKVCKDDPTRMHPNGNFARFFPGVMVPEAKFGDSKSSAIQVGASIVISDIVRNMDLRDHLSTFGEKRAGLILDFAAYMVLSEDNTALHYEKYTYSHPLLTVDHIGYSDSTVSRLFASITADERMSFLEKFNADMGKTDRIYLTYDSSNKNCSAGEIEMAEFGHPKKDIGTPVVNYSIAYNLNSGIPVFYELYPGSINDVSQLRYTVDKIKEYGYNNIGLILDRGYFSRDNIEHMDESGFGFIIMVKGMASFIRSVIEEFKGKFERKRKYFMERHMIYGVTSERQLYDGDKKRRYFHLYYDADLEHKQMKKLESKLANMKKLMNGRKGEKVTLVGEYLKYFDLTFGTGENEGIFYGYREKSECIEDELSHCGYFAIVSSDKMTAAEALSLYRGRDASEKLFSADKTFLGSDVERVASDESMEGKVFVGFIALIIRSRMYTLLRKRSEELPTRPNYMDVPAAIDELEKMEIVRQAHGSYVMDHAITARQKTVLSSFGIDAEVAERTALTLGEEIGKTLKEGKEPSKDAEKDDDEECGCDD